MSLCWEVTVAGWGKRDAGEGGGVRFTVSAQVFGLSAGLCGSLGFAALLPQFGAFSCCRPRLT